MSVLVHGKEGMLVKQNTLGKYTKLLCVLPIVVLNMNYPGNCWLTPPVPMSIFCWFTIKDWKEIGDGM